MQFINFFTVGLICAGISNIYGISLFNQPIPEQQAPVQTQPDGNLDAKNVLIAAETMLQATNAMMAKTVDKLRKIEQSIKSLDTAPVPNAAVGILGIGGLDDLFAADDNFFSGLQSQLAGQFSGLGLDLENIKNNTNKDVKIINNSVVETVEQIIRHGDNREGSYSYLKTVNIKPLDNVTQPEPTVIPPATPTVGVQQNNFLSQATDALKQFLAARNEEKQNTEKTENQPLNQFIKPIPQNIPFQ